MYITFKQSQVLLKAEYVQIYLASGEIATFETLG